MAISVKTYIVRERKAKCLSKGLEQGLKYLRKNDLLDHCVYFDIKEARDKSYSELKKENLLENKLQYSSKHRPLILNSSGSLHHLTYLFTNKLPQDKPYSILFLDNHNDGIWDNYDIKENRTLNCGQFVYDMIRDNKNVSGVFWLGLDLKTITYRLKKGAVKEKTLSKSANLSYKQILKRMCPLINELIGDRIYISFDLDCLSKDYVKTDYSQSRMSLDFALNLIEDLAKTKEFIGADICGLSKKGVDETSLRTYAEVYRTLYRALKG
jgi:arginase family enzyme